MKWIMLAVVAVLLTVDYGQTRDIANHVELKEGNFILGEHPESRAIISYFAICLMLTAVAVFVLPETYSMLLLGGLAALEAGVTWRNWKLGLRVRLHG